MSPARFVPLLFPMALLLVGCSSPGDPTSDLGNMNMNPGDMPAMNPGGESIRLTMGPVMVGPGEETTECITTRFPHSGPLDVVRFDSHLDSSHHVILYREDITAQQQATHPCPPLNINPFGNSQKAPLFIGESRDATLQLPQGVVYHFDDGALYTLETHFLNATGQAVMASSEVVLTLAAAGSQHVNADMLFYASVRALNKSYDKMGSGLPPHTITTLDPPGFKVPPAGIKVFGLTSHQHRSGKDFTISKSVSRSDPGQMLFDNKDWEHPPLLRFPDDKLLTFDSDKGEGLRWTCTYDNRTDNYVHFGESGLTDEMCIMWAYYYPSQGFDIYFE